MIQPGPRSQGEDGGKLFEYCSSLLYDFLVLRGGGVLPRCRSWTLKNSSPQVTTKPNMYDPTPAPVLITMQTMYSIDFGRRLLGSYNSALYCTDLHRWKVLVKRGVYLSVQKPYPPPLQNMIFPPPLYWYIKIYSSCTLFGFMFALFAFILPFLISISPSSFVFSPLSFTFSSSFLPLVPYFPPKCHWLIFPPRGGGGVFSNIYTPGLQPSTSLLLIDSRTR